MNFPPLKSLFRLSCDKNKNCRHRYMKCLKNLSNCHDLDVLIQKYIPIPTYEIAFYVIVVRL